MMYQAQMKDDTEGWHQVVITNPMPDAELQDPIRWCKLHTSDGKWDYGSKWGMAMFRFEQLEDAMMFRLIWCKDFG
jgi:hypothetical protein